tara:strand:- start:9381 stop:10481 length:1101 start_codon:yes stop_codon:yes gene_type:complete
VRVKFTKFPEEFRKLEKDFIKSFKRIGRKGEYILGKELLNFEKKIQKFLNVKYVLGVGNWTEGAVMVFKALELKDNKEIITVSNSFIATCGAISYAGLKPILVDISDDLNIDVNNITKKINKNTRAIMPVHLSGIPANMDKIRKICLEKNLLLIEDAAHAFGTKYKDKYLGTMGDVGIFSLHPRKNFHVLGDGGLIVTNNSKLYKKIKLIRNHGLINRDNSMIWGTNSRLDNIQAGFGNVMLKRIKVWNKKQLIIAKKYISSLKSYVEVPKYNDQISNPTFHQFIIKTQKRDQLKNYLKSFNIDTAIHYPVPIHLQDVFLKSYGKVKLPKTEKYSKRILSLPINPHMSNLEVNYVIDKVIKFFKKK